MGYIVRVVKSRRMRWAGHVARMGEDRGTDSLLQQEAQVAVSTRQQDLCLHHTPLVFCGARCTAVCGPSSYFRPAARSLTSRKGTSVTLPTDLLPCVFIHDARHRMSQ
jgi:hypothetical protein